MALRRAAHQLLDEPHVFSDPLALRIIGADERTALTADPRPDARRWIARCGRSSRAQPAGRDGSRTPSPAACGSIVLGAGLDTFAYRNPHPTLRVFEVDYPATQIWKRERLREANIPLPASVVFAAVNFETEALSDRLRDAGFDAEAPAFLSWLGVVPYLGAQAVTATLRWIAGLPRRTTVVFDYTIPPANLGVLERAAFNVVAARVAAADEPWQTFFEPSRLERDLMAAGFSLVTDVGPDAINQRYYDGRRDGLKVSGSMGHLMKAQV